MFKEYPSGKKYNHVCVLTLPFITTIKRTPASARNNLFGKVAAEGIGIFGSRGPQLGLMIR